jgi:transcriptional regulator with XRE-family HTH domain
VPLETGGFTPSGFTNRIREIAIHIPWYGFKTQARLARDSGVSPATISRLVHRKSQPSLKLSLQVTAALSHRLGRPLDVREVFSVDGRYPTPSVCVLTGCRSCLPPEAYDEEENLKPEYGDVKAGTWSVGAGVKGGV